MKKISNTVLDLLCNGFLVTQNSLNKRRIWATALIGGLCLLTFSSQMWCLFEGGVNNQGCGLIGGGRLFK